MGSFDRGLYLPTVGETGWGALVNTNFSKLGDAAFRQALSYIIYFDGTTYSGKNAQTGVIDYSGSDLGAVFNSISQALNNNLTTDQDSLTNYGGAIGLVADSLQPMVTQQALQMYTNQSLIGLGMATRIKAHPTLFPNTGTDNAPVAVINLGNNTVLQQRMRVANLTIDCASRAQQGIYINPKAGGNTGGPNGGNILEHVEVYNFVLAGYQLRPGNVTTGTTNTWFFRCFARDGSVGSKAMELNGGDCQVLWCNILGATGNSYCLYMQGGTIQVNEGHYSFNGTATNANIVVDGQSNQSIRNAYIDNVQNQPAVDVRSGGGSLAIIGNHVNGGALAVAAFNAPPWWTSAAKAVAFAFNPGYSYAQVVANRVLGNGATNQWDGIVWLNAASAATADIAHNRGRDCLRACSTSNATPTQPGSTAILVGAGSNPIHDANLGTDFASP